MGPPEKYKTKKRLPKKIPAAPIIIFFLRLMHLMTSIFPEKNEQFNYMPSKFWFVVFAELFGKANYGIWMVESHAIPSMDRTIKYPCTRIFEPFQTQNIVVARTILPLAFDDFVIIKNLYMPLTKQSHTTAKMYWTMSAEDVSANILIEPSRH
jgi:hypothetical protein